MCTLMDALEDVGRWTQVLRVLWPCFLECGLCFRSGEEASDGWTVRWSVLCLSFGSVDNVTTCMFLRCLPVMAGPAQCFPSEEIEIRGSETCHWC